METETGRMSSEGTDPYLDEKDKESVTLTFKQQKSQNARFHAFSMITK